MFATLPAHLSQLAAAVGSVPAFHCAFSRTDWFGDDVLWLAPEPDDPFRELIRAVGAASLRTRPMAASTRTRPRTSRSERGSWQRVADFALG